MAVENKTPDTALLTKTVEMPDGSFRPNIVNMEHTLSIAQSGNASTMTAAQLTHADLKSADAEARARVALGAEHAHTATGGSIKKGK